VVGLIDDDRSVLSALKDLMEAANVPAQSFGSAEEFLAADQRRRIACLVADIRLPGMSGLELQARLKAEGSPIPIIFITAHGEGNVKMQALTAGAVEFLSKPFDDDMLLEKVRAALEMNPPFARE
jgi:FixJ family two-component response regulator